MESLFYRMLQGGGTQFISAAYLICLLYVVVSKSDRIRKPNIFRAAYTLYALSLMIPVALTWLLLGIASRNSTETFWYAFVTSSGPILLGISILLFFNSILSSSGNQGVVEQPKEE